MECNQFIEAGGVAYWDMLVFKHNEHQIEEVRQLAKNMGFKNVRIKSPDGLVWDNKIQKRGVYDAQGKLEYYIEAAEDLQYVNATPGMERNYEDPLLVWAIRKNGRNMLYTSILFKYEDPR